MTYFLRVYFTLLLAFSISIITVNSQALPEKCGTMQNLLNMGISEQDFLDQINKSNQNSNTKNSGPRSTIIVPVVVHVFHNNGVGNISEAQVEDGIRIINEDFKRQNADTTLTRALFKPYAAGMDIEFRLAKIDPNGNCTNGIVRINTPLSFSGNNSIKPLSRWPADRYFNIWLVNFIQLPGIAPGSIVLGYGQFPGFGALNTYGFVNRNDRWGSIGSAVEYARTPTHEIGHCLNLLHTFQSGCGSDCSNSGDGVCDTPPVAFSTQGCNANLNLCSNDTFGPSPYNTDVVNQIENYMSYDDCQNMFSQQQVIRMENAINNNAFLLNLTSPANNIAAGTDDAYFFTATGCEPIADFYVMPNLDCANATIQFNELAYNGGKDSTWTYAWSFQGGTPATSSDQNPTVTFNQAGEFDVTLVVSNAFGSSTPLTQSKVVTIKPPSGSFIAPYLEDINNVDFPLNQIDSTLKWEVTWPDDSTYKFRRTTSAFYSAPSSVYLNNFDYNGTNKHELISPTMNLTNLSTGAAFFNFQVAHTRKANEGEELFLYSSKNCGRTWDLEKIWAAGNLNSSAPIATPFVPIDSSDWRFISYDISSLAGEDNIRFKLVFDANNGNNVYLDDIEVSDNNMPTTYVAGLSKVNFAKDFDVYPNPNNGELTISFDELIPSNFELSLFDSFGRSVDLEISKGSESPDNLLHLKLQEKNVTQGIYFLQVKSDQVNTIKKIIIEE